MTQTPTNQPITSCIYGNGRFELTEKGVYHFGKDKDGNEQPQWICSPLQIIAKTRDEKSGEWGRLLKWLDDDGKPHQWAMPLEQLEGDGAEVRRELARLGLQISPNMAARNLLAAYIKVWPVESRACCVDKLGWHGGVYVTPTEAIGNTGEIVVFQNGHALDPAFSILGDQNEWRESVAALAAGNSRLVFALCVAFAGALAEIAGEDSGGFHLRGASSSGKSTALNLAASVWGKPANFMRLWRSTTNGLEGLASLHNDCALILDEISQIDPSSAGDAAYMLANGQGKARASRNGLAKPAARWRLLFLSAGEESLTAIMERAGKKSSAGQEIRLADIEADAGAGMGIFEELHGYTNASTLAPAIKERTAKFHGKAGMKWLCYLAINRQELLNALPKQVEDLASQLAPKDAAGQVHRVARRFALVALAGELATRYTITGWPEGEAIKAVQKCFAAWLDGFGGNGNREERAILDHVLGFIETHGASRFEDLDATSDQRIINRAGFFRTGENGDREFLILPKTFRKEICQGFDEKTVKNVLRKAGLLMLAKDGKPTHVLRLPGLSMASRVYVIRYKDGAC